MGDDGPASAGDVEPAPVRRRERSRFIRDVTANIVANLVTVAMLWLVAQATGYVRGSPQLTAIAVTVLAVASIWGVLWLAGDRLGPSPGRLYWPIAVVAALVTSEMMDVTMSIGDVAPSLLVKIAVLGPTLFVVSLAVKAIRWRGQER